MGPITCVGSTPSSIFSHFMVSLFPFMLLSLKTFRIKMQFVSSGCSSLGFCKYGRDGFSGYMEFETSL